MLLSPHDALGLVLKCHLIAEDSLTNYLIVVKSLRNINKSRLTFRQKVELLDETDGLVFRSKGCLREINKIRNGFSHDFAANLEINPDSQIAQSLNSYLEAALRTSEKVIAKFEELGGEAEQIETLKWLISEMHTKVPDDPEFTGDNLAMLSQHEPREMLAYFVSSFCDLVAIEIFRHENVPQGKD